MPGSWTNDWVISEEEMRYWRQLRMKLPETSLDGMNFFVGPLINSARRFWRCHDTYDYDNNGDYDYLVLEESNDDSS